MEEAFNLHQELVALGGDEHQSFSRTDGYDASCFSEVSVAIAEGNWGEISEDEETIKSRIASHPLYPRLLNTYIDCQKMGAPPEMVSLLEEVRLGSNVKRPQAVCNMPGADPELDQFMVSISILLHFTALVVTALIRRLDPHLQVIYCEVLAKYRSDLARPFYEATSFITTVEKQLSDLCKNSALSSAEPARSSDESGGGEVVDGGSTARREGRELKDELLRRYSGYLGSLKQDFSKKKKKGNLPKEARQTLLDWWNLHYKWPYPTDADKLALVESTGLNQKQINNWFINQRKRRWKPSESMQFAVLNTLSSSFYLDSPR